MIPPCNIPVGHTSFPWSQERYKDRMSVVERIKNETQYLITFVKQLTPFIHNYKAVSDKIHPKLGTSSSVGPDGQSLNSMSQVREILVL